MGYDWQNFQYKGAGNPAPPTPAAPGGASSNLGQEGQAGADAYSARLAEIYKTSPGLDPNGPAAPTSTPYTPPQNAVNNTPQDTNKNKFLDRNPFQQYSIMQNNKFRNQQGMEQMAGYNRYNRQPYGGYNPQPYGGYRPQQYGGWGQQPYGGYQSQMWGQPYGGYPQQQYGGYNQQPYGGYSPQQQYGGYNQQPYGGYGMNMSNYRSGMNYDGGWGQQAWNNPHGGQGYGYASFQDGGLVGGDLPGSVGLEGWRQNRKRAPGGQRHGKLARKRANEAADGIWFGEQPYEGMSGSQFGGPLLNEPGKGVWSPGISPYNRGSYVRDARKNTPAWQQFRPQILPGDPAPPIVDTQPSPPVVGTQPGPGNPWDDGTFDTISDTPYEWGFNELNEALRGPMSKEDIRQNLTDAYYRELKLTPGYVNNPNDPKMRLTSGHRGAERNLITRETNRLYDQWHNRNVIGDLPIFDTDSGSLFDDSIEGSIFDKDLGFADGGLVPGAENETLPEGITPDQMPMVVDAVEEAMGSGDETVLEDFAKLFGEDELGILMSKLSGGQQFAQGGLVLGPGTGTSDSIDVNIDGDPNNPAKLSTGEFVMNSDAVNQIGPEKLDAANKMARYGMA